MKVAGLPKIKKNALNRQYTVTGCKTNVEKNLIIKITNKTDKDWSEEYQLHLVRGDSTKQEPVTLPKLAANTFVVIKATYNASDKKKDETDVYSFRVKTQ